MTSSFPVRRVAGPDRPRRVAYLHISLSRLCAMTSAAVFAAGSVPGQVVCLDLEQTTLVGDLTGSITGGAGRFKGASGSWNIVDAVVPIGTSITTARLFVDLH